MNTRLPQSSLAGKVQKRQRVRSQWLTWTVDSGFTYAIDWTDIHPDFLLLRLLHLESLAPTAPLSVNSASTINNSLGGKKKQKNMDLSPKGEWAPTVPACLLSTCLVRSSARLARGSYQKLLKDLDDRLLWERWVIFGEPRRDGKDKKRGAVLQPLTSVTG